LKDLVANPFSDTALKIAPQEVDIVVVGGGFFGCCLAIHLKKKNKRVVLIEMGDDILGRASYANQARVHNGYHYPRSLLTALRSRINFPRFVNDFPDSIFTEFEQYYAIGKYFSKVNANQYRIFMERIGAEIRPAPNRVKDLVNLNLVDDIFAVKEFAFDAIKLKEHLKKEILSLGIPIIVNAKVVKVHEMAGDIEVLYQSNHGDQEDRLIRCEQVYNCTYSHINQILRDSDIEVIPFKHEVTEMALLDMPPELKGIGITVMCGPFFSFMPFPSTPYHSLSHVRYTPHAYWYDDESRYRDTYEYLNQAKKESHALHMVKDAQRYIPLLDRAHYEQSIWEIKTVLPSSEIDDGRPIMIKKDHGLLGLTCILGGKIDNIYDVFSEIDGDEN
jgi:glycine/D-amino acid oxidase-like deaminating enzyme